MPTPVPVLMIIAILVSISISILISMLLLRPARPFFPTPFLTPVSPANSPTMPARLDGNASPARRNALFRAKSAKTIATSDAPEAKGEGPSLAAGTATIGAGSGGGETTAA